MSYKFYITLEGKKKTVKVQADNSLHAYAKIKQKYPEWFVSMFWLNNPGQI